MGIILNEVKEAERIINTGEVGKKPASTIYLLARYYRQQDGMTKKQAYDEVMDFMKKNCSDFVPAMWENYIEDASKKGTKHLLREISYVPITQKEIDTVESVDNFRYEKLLFTMLCYAKFYNIVSPANNDWVNAEVKELYSIARVTVKYAKDRFVYLHDLAEHGLISFSKKNDNLNIKVEYICNDGEIVAKINDFRELGYEYMNILGDGKFVRCEMCGRLVRSESGRGRNKKYCSDCARKVKNSQNKSYYYQKMGKK